MTVEVTNEAVTKSILSPEMHIIAYMDTIMHQQGAEHLFSSYVTSMRNRGHRVDVCCRDISEYNEDVLTPLERIRSPRKLLRFINDSDADIVWLTHFKSIWILPFINKTAVLHFLEPPRAFNEPWIFKHKNILEKIIVTAHGYVDRYIIKNYLKYVIAISAFSAESFYRAYGKFANYVYPGVDPQEFYPENMWARDNYVLLVGGRDVTKQVELAIASVSLVDERIRPRLKIVSTRRDDMQGLADKLKVNVEWETGLTTDQLRKVYQRAICTVCTSVAEPFGLTAVESVACGTPVVAVDEGGFRETVSGCVGVRVTRHPLPMAMAITALITEPKRVTLNERFHLETCVDQFEDNLSEIVQNTKRKKE